MPAQNASMSNIPLTREGHADTLVDKMDGIVKKAGNVVTGGSTRAETPPRIPDDVDAPVTAAPSKKKKPDKHSMDYMIRSGIAGGLAGCAVSARMSVKPLP